MAEKIPVMPNGPISGREVEESKNNISPERLSGYFVGQDGKVLSRENGEERNSQEHETSKGQEFLDKIAESDFNWEGFLEYVHKIGASDYFEFLGTIREHPNRHLLSQEAVSAILDKGFAVLESYNSGQEGDLSIYLSEIESALQFHGDFKRERPDQESLTDKTLKAFIGIYQKHQKIADEFWQILSQNGQTIRPDIFVKGMAEMLWRDDVSEYFKTTSLHATNYLYAFFGDNFNDAISKGLDFENPENYFRTATFLEFVRKLHSLSQELSFSERSTGKIEKVIRGAAEKNRGSYLLSLRAKDIVGEIEEYGFAEGFRGSFPARISRNNYALRIDGKMYISEDDSYEEISRLVEEYRDLTKKELSHQEGRGFFIFPARPEESGDRGIDGQAKEILSRIRGLFRPVTAEDLTVKRADKTEAQKEVDKQNLFDYQYLSSPQITKFIEKDLGVRISELSLKEQFYFLQFIKSKSGEDVGIIKDFARKFGTPGLRTFLLLDYGQEIGNQLVELGTRNEKEAKKIFETYARLIDSAETTRINLQKEKESEKPDSQDKMMNNLSGEVYEAILRRSKDLLIAASMIAGQDIEGFSLDDVAASIRSIDVFLSILNGLTRGEDYRFFKEKSQSENHFNFEVWDERYTPDLKYKLKIFIRPEAEKDAQARINFELDFDTENPDEGLQRAFRQKTDYKVKKKTVEQSVLRVAIDREEIGGEEKISLDVGRSARTSAEFDRTGDKLGNILALVSQAGHHTFESFSREYASQESFKKIAQIFRSYIENKV